MNFSSNFNSNKNKLFLIISVTVAIALLWLSLSNIGFTKLIDLFREINYFIIILSLFPAIISLITQTFRWQLTFSNFESKAEFWSLFRAISIGNAFNNILPKGGEFIKPFIYASRNGIKYSTVLATVGIDRFYDFVGLIFFIILLIIFYSETFELGFDFLSIELLVVILVILGIMAFIIFYKLSSSRDNAGLFSKIILKFPEKSQSYIMEKIRFFKDGLQSISSAELNIKMLIWTIISWLLHSLNLYIAFFALDFQSNLQLTYFDSISLLIAISIGITVLPVPGGTGVQHYVVKVMLISLFGIEPESAFAYAAINHATIFFMNLLLGIICIIPERKYIFDLKNDNIR